MSENVGTETVIYVLETVENIAAFLRQNAPADPPNTGRSMLQRERAHRAGKLSNPLNGEQSIFALLGWEDIRTLEGRLLTLIDAAFSDGQQRKAFKDMFRRELWFNWVRYLDMDEPHGGIWPNPA